LGTNKATAVEAARAYMAAFEQAVAVPGASGQVQRVARRFALIAAAGELAIDACVLPWPKGHAGWAARKCFDAWFEHRGGTDRHEVEQSLERVRGFLQMNGESCFPWLGDGSGEGDESAESGPVVHGYRRRRGDDCVEFLVHPESFSDVICEGMNASDVAGHLLACGFLIPDAQGKRQRSERVPAGNPTKRVYVIRAELLGAANSNEEGQAA